MQNLPPTQPYGSSPQGTPSGSPGPGPLGKTSIGLEPNIAAALSYITIVGLIFFIIEKESNFVRFHALQSVITAVGAGVLMVVVMIAGVILGIALAIVSEALGMLVWGLVYLLFFVVWLALIGVLIYAAVKAYQGQTFRIPGASNIADKVINK